MNRLEKVLQLVEFFFGLCGIIFGTALHFYLRGEGVLVPGALLLVVTGFLGVLLSLKHSKLPLQETLLGVLRRTLLFLNGSLTFFVGLELFRLI